MGPALPVSLPPARSGRSSCIHAGGGALVLVALLAAAGCQPKTTTPTNRSPDGMSCGQRLVGGVWRFTGFTPQTQVSPQTTQAIERLHGTLRLGFDGKSALTTGPGLHHLGPYRVENDGGTACRIVAPDDAGNQGVSDVRFLDANHIEVIDRSSAVPGRATMERVPGNP